MHTTAKPEMYHIDTSNVLFILSGAFVGLDGVVKRRVAKGVRISFSLIFSFDLSLHSRLVLPQIFHRKRRIIPQGSCLSLHLIGEHRIIC
jgi:hypothetical protein